MDFCNNISNKEAFCSFVTKNINPKIKYPLQTLSGRYCIKFRQVRWKIRNWFSWKC